MDGHVLRIAAVDVASGRFELGTEILVRAARGGINPADPHALAGLKSVRSASQPINASHNLVPQHHGQPRRRCSPLDFVEFGVAHATH